MASTDLQQLKILLAVRDREFAKAMDRNTRRVDRFSKQSSKGLSKTTKSFNALTISAKRLLPALSAAVLVAQTKRVIDSLDNIGKTADKLGLTTDALQELRAAADAAGVSSTTLDMAMQRFGRRVAEARQGTGEAKAALEEMGIELFTVSGGVKDIDSVLGDVADAFTEVADQTDMNRLAMKLFDSEGVAMVNMLRDGQDALSETRAEMQKLGIVIDEDLIRKAEDSKTQLSAMASVIKSNLSVAIIELAPLLVSTASGIAKLSTEASTFINLFKTLGAAPLNLGEQETLDRMAALSSAMDRFPHDANAIKSINTEMDGYAQGTEEWAKANERLIAAQKELISRAERTEIDPVTGVEQNVQAVGNMIEAYRAALEERRAFAEFSDKERADMKIYDEVTAKIRAMQNAIVDAGYSRKAAIAATDDLEESLLAEARARLPPKKHRKKWVRP